VKKGNYARHASVWGIGGPGRSDELEFYSSLILGYGKKVLYPMCADGDIAAGLAEKGYIVTAFDSEPEMIEAANRKYPPVSDLSFSVADITAFDLPGKDNAACIIASGDLHHLSTEKEVLQALGCIYSHLASRSCLILELHYPSSESWHFPVQRFPLLDDPEKHLEIWKTSESSYDAETLRQHIKQEVFIEQDGVSDSFLHELELQLIPRPDLLRMLESAGFSLVKEYGGYDFSKWEQDSGQWILLAEKS
jgi:hypothetical protein